MKKIILIAIVAMLALQGCATTRSVVDVPLVGQSSAGNVSGPLLYIRNVNDVRSFQESPRSADIPSLGFEGADAASSSLKARAIGRKRNSWGKAMGDVLLAENMTVEILVRDAAAAGFQDAGWRVVQSPIAGENVTAVDITVEQLWSWFQPGFWAVATNARIETGFDFSNDQHLPAITIEFKDRMQFVTDSDWQNTVHEVLVRYREELANSAAPSLPLH